VSVNATGHCDTTGKISYASRHAAAQSRGRRRNVGRRMRPYLCNHCRCWHLTTEAFAR
jgi:hypothetical protein